MLGTTPSTPIRSDLCTQICWMHGVKLFHSAEPTLAMRINAFQGMDTQEEQLHHVDSKLQSYAVSDARRPHTRILQHHGHLRSL